MEPNQSNFAAPPTPQPRTGLAIACLVLGILAVFTSVLLVGALLGLLTLLLGVLHLSKRRGPNGMAWAGIALAVLSLMLSAGMAMLYVKGFQRLQGGIAEMTNQADEGPQVSDWTGVKAPDFSVTTLDGETLRLSELRGRRVVLDFWATWCSPCRMEIPHFVQLATDNPKDELLIVGISSEDVKTLKQFVKKETVNYPIASAENLPPPFDHIHAVPTTFFIDRNGVIQEVVVGYSDYERLKKLALAADRKGSPKTAPDTGSGREDSKPGTD